MTGDSDTITTNTVLIPVLGAGSHAHTVALIDHLCATMPGEITRLEVLDRLRIVLGDGDRCTARIPDPFFGFHVDRAEANSNITPRRFAAGYRGDWKQRDKRRRR